MTFDTFLLKLQQPQDEREVEEAEPLRPQGGICTFSPLDFSHALSIFSLSLSLSFFRISLSLTQTHSMENLYHPSLIALAWMREKIIPRLRKANFHPRNEKETPFPRMEIVSAGKIDGGGRRRFRTSARAVTVKRRSSVR